MIFPPPKATTTFVYLWLYMLDGFGIGRTVTFHSNRTKNKFIFNTHFVFNTQFVPIIYFPVFLECTRKYELEIYCGDVLQLNTIEKIMAIRSYKYIKLKSFNAENWLHKFDHNVIMHLEQDSNVINNCNRISSTIHFLLNKLEPKYDPIYILTCLCMRRASFIFWLKRV